MKREPNRQKRSLGKWLRIAGMLAVLLSIVACGAPAAQQTTATSAPDAGQTAASAAEPTPAAAATEAITIQFITPGALGLERTMYENFVFKFQEANPDIKVKVSFEAWGDYMTKLPTILAGGAVPDVIHQHMSIVQDYAAKGALTDLTPYMQQDGVLKENYIPALFDAFSHEGKVWALPKDSAAWGIYYNKTMFDAAGVPYPKDDWTMQEFQQAALALTLDANGNAAGTPGFDANNIKQWGFNWFNPLPFDSEQARAWVLANGADWYNEDYTESRLNDPKVLEVLKMFQQMRCEQHSIPTPSQAQGQGDPFRAGLTAMTIGFHSVDFFSREEKVKFDYDVTYAPKGPGGQYVMVGASGWAIPAQAKNKDAAWKLVKYLTSKEVQSTIGEQKRWGVSLAESIDVIIPESTPAKNFAAVHTEPLKGNSDRKVAAWKFPPNQSRIKEILTTEFDPVWTCAGGDVETAANNAKTQIDAVLKEIKW
jgi:multiple sugar transport system substrate-binding protein